MNSFPFKTFELGWISLSQLKFNAGRFYAVAIHQENYGCVAIDLRFYIQMQEGWMPSQNGFWVKRKHFNVFTDALCRELSDLEEHTCWEAKSKKFVIRYSPQYGGGFDFRHHVEGEKYTGWTKKGVRIAEKDYPQFLNLVQKSIKKVEDDNLLKEFKIVSPSLRKKSQPLTRKTNYTKKDDGDSYVNPLLDELFI